MSTSRSRSPPTLAEANDLVAQATTAGLLLGSAPDTFLGSAAQTARAALDDGAIGEPIGVAAFITSNRVETWHPDPTFLFQPGGGPVADLGPYYLTAMVNLLGPLASVMARSRIGIPTLPVTSPAAGSTPSLSPCPRTSQRRCSSRRASSER